MRWLVFLLVLSGCIRDQVLIEVDDWTGARSVTTQEREIFRDGPGIMVARPLIVDDARGRTYAILTNVRRRDANGPRVLKMTSGGVRLPYKKHDRLRTHCIDGCQKAEIGAITLTESAFRRAATTGFQVRVWGERGRYFGTVPAEAFARVLAQAP